MMNNNMNNNNVNLSAGDKIKLVKPIGPLGEDFVGDVYEITKYEGGLYYFECPYGMGCFTPNEFDNHFVMANDEEYEKYSELADTWTAMVDAYHKAVNGMEDSHKHECHCHNCDCHQTTDSDGKLYMDDNEDFEFELGDDVPEFVEDILAKSEIVCSSVFDCCAVVSCKLPNGYILVEHSAMSDAAHYDYATEVKYAMDKIVQKVISLEVYVDKTLQKMEDDVEPMPMPNVKVDVDQDKLDEINKRIKKTLKKEERKKRDKSMLAEIDEILDELKNNLDEPENKDVPYVDDFKFRMNPWWAN